MQNSSPPWRPLEVVDIHHHGGQPAAGALSAAAEFGKVAIKLTTIE